MSVPQWRLTPPEWATELVAQVCKDYRRALPRRFTWSDQGSGRAMVLVNDTGSVRTYTVGRNKHSSGVTHSWRSAIHVTAGKDEVDQKLVLLHELAHHIVGRTKKGKREHHSLRFWRLAFELYHRYGLDLGAAYEREKGYKVKATWAYNELADKLSAQK